MSTERMTLAARVAELETWEQVVALLRGAGRRVVPVDLRVLGQEAPWWDADVGGVWVLNPGEGAPIWLVTVDRGDARRDDLDRHLLRAARRSFCGVSALVAVGPGGVDLAVAVADERRVERCRTSRRLVDERAFDAWSALASTADAPIALLRAFRLLRKRSVGVEFFRDVRGAVAGVEDGWTGGPVAAADRRSLAITLLCRLMFLYFVQARGWLDADPGFIAALLLDPDADAVYGERLRPLFFAVLNLPIDDRTGPWCCPGIPYLNGGLFEPTALETAHPELDLPDATVRDLVGILERYRFVEVERDGASVGLDPEMLGTVFESLMCPAVRGRSGTFYTPAALVAEVVEDTLRVALARELGNEAAGRLLDGRVSKEDRSRSRAAVDGLTVLDPAMGSGAFLVGALERLVPLRRALFGESAAEATRAVIERNLYGVDLSATAVTIAGLRLWLALAAVTEAATPSDVEPLPNLAHRLRQGDALLGLATFGQLEGIEVNGATVGELRDLASRYPTLHGDDKRRAAARMRVLERAAAVDVLTGCLGRIASRRAELDAALAPDLFGVASRWTAAQAKELDALSSRERAVKALLRRSERGEWAPGFDFAVHFAPVTERGGFDAVIGNPPWVRLSNIGVAERRRLKATYSWIADAGDGRTFGAQPDLAVAFVQRGVALLRPGGALGMVVPAKLLSTGYAGALRAGLLASAPPIRVRDLSESPLVHFAADVLPATLLVSRGGASECRLVRVDDGVGGLAITTVDRLSLDGRPGGEWTVLAAGAVDVFRRLVGACPALSERFAIRLGVKTGANAVFVGKHIDVPTNVSVLRGRGVSAMRVTEVDRMLFAHDLATGDPLPQQQIPAAAIAWLEAHRAALEARVDASPGDPLWRVFRVRPAALGHRVAWRDIGQRLEAAYLPPVVDGGPVALNTTYTVEVGSPAQGRRLAAWLCTTPARFVAAARAERALSGYRRFLGRNVGSVPVPDVVIEGDDRFDRLAAAVDDDPGDVDAWDALDRQAAEALGLTETELAILRGESDRLSLRSEDLRSVVWALPE